MANLTLLGSPRRGGSSNTFKISSMSKEGLLASITADGTVAAGGTAPHCVLAGRKGSDRISGYTSAREIPVILASSVNSITIGQPVYIVEADGKADNASGAGKTATRAVFVSTAIGTNGASRNIEGSETNNEKWALISFEGGL